MTSRFASSRRRGSANTALILLLLAVLLPTLCVLWFMNEVVRTASYAVRQRLVEAYRGQLDDAIRKFQQEWTERCDKLPPSDPVDPAASWLSIVRTKRFASVIILGPERSYPGSAHDPPQPKLPDPPGAAAAAALENDRRDFLGAAEAWSRIAAQTTTVPMARAPTLQALARCLVRAGETTAAISVLEGPLSDPELVGVRDANGRLIQPSAQLLALQLRKTITGSDRDFHEKTREFCKHLEDYRYWQLMPSAQRLFLMNQATGLTGHSFATQREEQLAHLCFEHLVDPGPLKNTLTRVPNVEPPTYYLLREYPSWKVIALFDEYSILNMAKEVLKREIKLPVFQMPVYTPSQDLPAPSSSLQFSYDEPLLVAPLGGANPQPGRIVWTEMPGWRVAVYIDPDTAPEQSARRIAVYLWTGFLVILAFAAVALVTGRYVLRQTKLTRLKNDLIATVSHELKTPISSMRVLVDTLIDDPSAGEQQRREYLALIAKENARLSRLIDNFLTFSRMERNKRAFEFRDVDVKELVDEAIDAAGDRFRAPGCSLTVNVEPDLPRIVGDRDALVTVILNLLDNAYKYCGEMKEIGLHAHREGDHVHIDVSDNGIGIPPRAQKRIFDRFYQVDESLSRQAGGCGLGLSIVKFIVEAHGGRITVSSQQGQGSKFAVQLRVGGAG